MRTRGSRADCAGDSPRARACHGPDSVHAELRERRMGAPLAEVGAALAVQGAVGAGAGAASHRAAGRARLRVPDPAEARRDRAQLEPRPGGREHGPLELHLAAPPRALLRPPGVLPHLQQQERRARRRRLPAQGLRRHAAAQEVSAPPYLPYHTQPIIDKLFIIYIHCCL